jgi:O-antigen biosynthesis protein
VSAPAPPTVAVVLCCYTEDRWTEIMAALGSVRAQTRPADAVLVVVDHNPALYARVRDAAPADVVVTPNRHRPGLSGARNTGVVLAGTDVVAFLDDDAVAEPDWLAHLVAEYADPGVAAVGGRIDPVWPGERPGWFPPEFDWVVGCSYTGQPSSRAVVRNVIGANMSFRRAPVLAAGGFAEELGRTAGALPLGCEETELCIRLTARTGGQVVLQPLARVRHHVSGERGTVRYLRRRCFAEGLSKAAVSARAGSGPGLSAERGYALRVLPAGVARGVRDALRHGDGAAARRAAAIVLGFAATAAGYLVGRLRARRGRVS